MAAIFPRNTPPPPFRMVSEGDVFNLPLFTQINGFYIWVLQTCYDIVFNETVVNLFNTIFLNDFV